MHCGYLIYTNIKYLHLAQVLVDSLMEFSNYPIEITTTGFDFPKKDARIINKRHDETDKYFSDVCYFKNLYMAAITDFDVSVVLDADMVVNTNIDDLMELAIAHPRPYTLNAGHGCDPHNQEEGMEYAGVKVKSMPYVYSTYFSCSESKPFLKECWELSQTWKRNHFIPPNTGESILNIMLWANKVTEQVNCWLPYIDVFSHYISQGNEPTPLDSYYEGKELSYHVWHGQKDEVKAREMLNILRWQYQGNPLLKIKPRLLKHE